MAGQFADGMICAESLTGKTSEMDLDQSIAWLESDPVTGRGGAICHSSDDDMALHTALEIACRELGPRCSYEVKQLLEHYRSPKVVWESAHKERLP